MVPDQRTNVTRWSVALHMAAGGPSRPSSVIVIVAPLISPFPRPLDTIEPSDVIAIAGGLGKEQSGSAVTSSVSPMREPMNPAHPPGLFPFGRISTFGQL